jgi:hypothetical protein
MSKLDKDLDSAKAWIKKQGPGSPVSTEAELALGAWEAKAQAVSAAKATLDTAKDTAAAAAKVVVKAVKLAKEKKRAKAAKSKSTPKSSAKAKGKAKAKKTPKAKKAAAQDETDEEDEELMDLGADDEGDVVGEDLDSALVAAA